MTIGPHLRSLVLVPALLLPLSAESQEGPTVPETEARHAIVLDGQTGAVLLEKGADDPFAPASLAKLLTAELAAEAVGSGLVEPFTAYNVTEHAWRTGGAPSRTATMFAELRSAVPVDALLRGVTIQAANDAAIILAEGLEGSEQAFVAAMNERAQTLGMTSSRFVNATGLPAEGQAVSVRDLGRLAMQIRANSPDLYALYREPEFEWNGIRQRNRNPLLGRNIGATGLALGFTEGFGYSIVGTAERDDRAAIVVLAGLPEIETRTLDAERLLGWAFEEFEPDALFAAGSRVGSAAVFGGTADEVELLVRDEIVLPLPTAGADAVRARISYEGPLVAPVAAGTEIGRVDIFFGDLLSLSRPVFASADVPQGSFGARAFGAMRELAFGWVRLL